MDNSRFTIRTAFRDPTPTSLPTMRNSTPHSNESERVAIEANIDESHSTPPWPYLLCQGPGISLVTQPDVPQSPNDICAQSTLQKLTAPKTNWPSSPLCGARKRMYPASFAVGTAFDAKSETDPEKSADIHDINDLPLEILEEIFLVQTDRNFVTRSSIDLPPVMTSHPWSVSQVCRRWRHVSRSMPALWRTYFSYNERWPGEDDDYDFTLSQLRWAAEILPEVAYITLSLCFSAKTPPVPVRRLIPYLALISKLSWIHDAHDLPGRESLEILPPSSLSRIKKLSVAFPKDSPIEGSCMGLFGPTPQLEDLALESDAPAFLFSDIPWNQLRHLKLSFRTSTLPEETRNLWMDLARLNPFGHMTSLTTLFLSMGVEYFEILLSCDFPWQQVEIFTVHWNDRPDRLAEIMKPLQKCTSLLKFQLHILASLEMSQDISPQDRAAHSVLLPSLTHFVGRAVPAAIIGAVCASETFSSLDIGHVELDQLYDILEQCPRVKKLNSHIHGNPALTRRKNGKVLLPCLDSLDISLFHVGDPYFPCLLQAPVLSTFRMAGDFSAVIFEHVLDFLTTSNVRLRRFSLLGVPYDEIPLIPIQTRRKLFSSLSTCSSIAVSATIPDDMLSAFAKRELFPELEWLLVISSDPHGLLTSFRSRIQLESASGTIKLRAVRIEFISTDADIVARTAFEQQFRELEKNYDISCRIYWGK
ncbi:hypothetical protein H0H93_001945 [Arthromyces matolae]|nr:hypothetical protein H0H93_001945 [Arthromyces matolae]